MNEKIKELLDQLYYQKYRELDNLARVREKSEGNYKSDYHLGKIDAYDYAIQQILESFFDSSDQIACSNGGAAFTRKIIR